jgi:hypothetical protein
MTDVAHIEYRVDDNSVFENSIDLLPYQFQNRENIEKLSSVIATMKQRIDDVVVDLAKYRLIDTAYGRQLDNIGSELGVDRQGVTDDEYRVLLKIRSFRRHSQGTRSEIVDLIPRFTGSSKSDVDIYVGGAKTVDIAFNDGCSAVVSTNDEITKILPILTNYRFISKVGDSPFGFVSVFNESEDLSFEGFGSVFDSVLTTEGGRLGSLVSASK